MLKGWLLINASRLPDKSGKTTTSRIITPQNKVTLQPNRHKDQLHNGKLGANPMTLVLRINVRYLEVHQAETDQEEDREKWISNIERAILKHPDEDNFVAEMYKCCKCRYTILSEDAKMMIYSQDNLEGFE